MKDHTLRSVHTTTFPKLLSELNASLFVTTYQAGKLIMLRDDGGVLNTHFRNFARPMGLAISAGRLAIGCQLDVQEFLNVPSACAQLSGFDIPPKSKADVKHDACFLPRRSHCTGDVQIHEMAWLNGDLIFVNTTFSCLAQRCEQYSFEPVWRPDFVTHLTPGDNCHLNGLAIDHDRILYVTALGESNRPGGWRESKRSGGVVIDVQANAIVARNLSMPHSPRWYRNKLWVLESGDGSLGFIDLARGTYEAISRLPGFTRGLTFAGPWAFVGLSQVRESAIFSGIPLVERLTDRTCGIWVVNIETGETVAFCEFEEGVQEIFAAELLCGANYPDLVNEDQELIARTYVLSDKALHDVPSELRN